MLAILVIALIGLIEHYIYTTLFVLVKGKSKEGKAETKIRSLAEKKPNF